MDDLISRQQLIGAMYREAFLEDSNLQRWDGGCWIRYKLFEKVVNNLPSAQRGTVKVVRCKDCKHHDGERSGQVYCPDIIEGWISEYFFCAGGERREDG